MKISIIIIIHKGEINTNQVQLITLVTCKAINIIVNIIAKPHPVQPVRSI